MTDIDTARMREEFHTRWQAGTHYKECYYMHSCCAIAALCDELDAARARIAELETVQAIRAGRMESALTDIRVCIEQELQPEGIDRLRIIDGLAAEGLSEPGRHWVTVSNEFVREDENEVGLKGE